MNKLLHPLYAYPLAATAFLRAAGQSLRLVGLDHTPLTQHRVPRDYFGVNVAPGEDSDTDDYIVARLRELGLDRVRMDFSYESFDGPAQRLLDRLLDEQIEVMLDLLPPLTEAAFTPGAVVAARADSVESASRSCYSQHQRKQQ